MTIDIRLLAKIEELTLNTSSLYLVFGYGTGDTFNAMIHLSKAPPIIKYELIIKKSQLNLVNYLLGLYHLKPSRVQVVDYWAHDFSINIQKKFPNLPFLRGIEKNLDFLGLIDVWHNPFNYNKIIPLLENDIDKIVSFFNASPAEMYFPENSVILFPTAGANFNDYIPKWSNIVTLLRQLGVDNIFVNLSGRTEYGNEMVDGATPIDLTHEQLIKSVYQTKSKIKIIAVRSGVIDILRFSKSRALILYQPQPAGIFETCRFGLLRNNLDLVESICLNNSIEHQDNILEFYISNFIGSKLES